jgi:amidase
MKMHARHLIVSCSALLSVALGASRAVAGGGPMNVVVLYNADVPSAVTVAQHYGTVRSLPKGHLCGVSGVLETTTTIDVPTFQSMIQKPLDACIAALPEPGLIDYVVLVRGLPYIVTLPTYGASLQAMIQVRHAKVVAASVDLAGQGQPADSEASVANPFGPASFTDYSSDYTITNPYEAWYENASALVRATTQAPAFHSAAATTGGGYVFTATDGGTSVDLDAGVYDYSGNNLVIVSALDGFDYTDATDLVDRAASSDGTFPPAEVMCMLGADSARAARDPECEFATRMLTSAGLDGAFVTPFNGSLSGLTVASYFTGSDSLQGAIAGNTYVPGAIASNITSFGAAPSNFFCDTTGTMCPASENQTSIARFVRAGVTGVDGTVEEPENNVFPNAGTLLLYTFGYSMGESYFFNQRFLYWQNLYLGDPLATPYAKRPEVTLAGSVTGHPRNAPLVVHATHSAGIQTIDLYIGGKQAMQAKGDTLSYMPTEAVGATLDIMAVAVANNVPVTRTGWVQPNQKPQPDVQGWSAAAVTLGPDAPVPDGGADAAADGGVDAGMDASRSDAGAAKPPSGGASSSGCSCRAAPGGAATSWWIGAGAVVLFGARRMRKRRVRAKSDVQACVALLALAGCSSGGSASPMDAGARRDTGTVSDAAADARADARAEAASPEDYLDQPLRTQVTALDNGTITSAGLTAAYLARIGMRDPGDGGVHAIIVLDPKAATHAAALDAERGDGALLQGADILVKDNIDTDGIATTAGSLAMSNNVPPADAFVIARLHAAHGLMLGKTNLSEWANFRSTTATSGWSSVGGQTYNGRNTGYDPCGSSSGSAAAVAAGLASAALGTETNGSLVCPASVNGVVGFKPTVGLVSRAGVIPISTSQDTVGPLTRTVGDAARMLRVIAGPDPNDPLTSAIPKGMSLDFETPLTTATLKGKRLGVVSAFGFGAPVMAVFNAQTALMQKAGATLVDASLDVSSWGSDELTVLLYEFKVDINAYLAAHPVPGQAMTLQDLIDFDTAHAATVMPYFGQELSTEAEATTGLSSPTYTTALADAQSATRAHGILAALSANHLDALICPTNDPAWVIDYATGDPDTLHSASGPAAVAGYPHLTVPMGTVGGLPVGMSFFGAAWDDANVLALGYAYEQLAK